MIGGVQSQKTLIGLAQFSYPLPKLRLETKEVVYAALLPPRSVKNGVFRGRIFMDTQIFEEYQKQFTEWQKKFFDTWVSTLPSADSFKMPENLGKGIEVQQELVTHYLEAQETAIKLSLETQKKCWEGYFELMRKTSEAKGTAVK
jgi:hypothetical protein